MKDKEKSRKAINSRLPEDVVMRWHLYALQTKQNKEDALADLIKRGTKK